MPIHFEDRDITSEVAGLSSALIVPCYMCPAVTVAVREGKPFMRFFSSLLKSAPFEEYLKRMRARLAEAGVETKVLKSVLFHHWFMCMWTSGKREQLVEDARGHDAVIVLGCESATETVSRAVPGCKVIEAMEVTGIMNAELNFSLPGNISFENCTTVPISKDVAPAASSRVKVSGGS